MTKDSQLQEAHERIRCLEEENDTLRAELDDVKADASRLSSAYLTECEEHRKTQRERGFADLVEEKDKLEFRVRCLEEENDRLRAQLSRPPSETSQGSIEAQLGAIRELVGAEGKQCTYSKVQALVEELEVCYERIKETKKDTDRLDWLSRQFKTSTVYMSGKQPWTPNHIARGMVGATFREAIDEARGEEE